LRAALLMPLCALAVHQARYYLTYGRHGGAQLAREGHAYLSTLEPIVLFAAALAVGAFVGRLARTWQAVPPVPAAGARLPEHRHGTLRIWALCALVLIGFYCVQELCEVALAPGHPAGLAGVLGHGGWLALPVALLIAGALTAALRVSEALVVLAARHGVRSPVPDGARVLLRRRSHRGVDWRLDPDCGIGAGRAPPLPLPA
jgi:hypothetical protein